MLSQKQEDEKNEHADTSGGEIQIEVKSAFRKVGDLFSVVIQFQVSYNNITLRWKASQSINYGKMQ